MDSIYGLEHSIASFAVSNQFVTDTNKACYKLGQELMPFCFYANDWQKSYGVLDFSTFDGFAGQGSLVDEIVNYRHKVFKDYGINVDIRDETKKKLLLYDYLLTISICYVEVPKYVTKNGMATPTYDKFLATRNPAIMAAWMGGQPYEMQAKYSGKIKSRQVEFNVNEIRLVKLMHSSKGNSITVPRGVYNIEEMTCIPLYMLYAFIEGFKPVLQDNIVKFSYLKDNGTLRELNTTLSESILKDYYSDPMFVAGMLSGVDINTIKQGGMMLSSKMNRGYIKIPELGASIYDGTGVRSLNVARILKAEKVDEVDRSFINVDLGSVVTNFEDCCDYLLKSSPDDIKSMYKLLVSEDKYDESKIINPVTCSDACKDYVRNMSIWLSTQYHRSLHLFMINNPQWFPLYTGKPAQNIVSSNNMGVMPMDF